MIKGVSLRFASEFDTGANHLVQRVFTRLRASLPPGVREIIPGLVALYVEYDDDRLSSADIRHWMEQALANDQAVEGDERRTINIGVVYGGEDLQAIARRVGLPVAEVIRLHSEPTYKVAIIGFSPGQPYLESVDPAIRIPRRNVPRKVIEPYSVAMANEFTSVVPSAQPAGWDLLGRALERIYDPHRSCPALLRAGDRVRFVPSEGTPPSEPEHLPLLPPDPKIPCFDVLEAGLLDLIVDRGRFLVGEVGLPRNGPIDSRSAHLANAVVGNHQDSPLLEINVKGPVLRACRSCVVAFAGAGLRVMRNGVVQETYTGLAVRPGDVLTFAPKPPGTRGYLAVAGGFDSERFLGSASVGIRGRIGRPLQLGDTLGVERPRSARPGHGFRPRSHIDARELRLRVVPGPQFDWEASDAISAQVFTVASADRMGVRFHGLPVPGGEITSEAVPVGAIQVPPGGEPILLLNDRGTTGGYSKPVIVHPADLPLAAQLYPGAQVRFSLVLNQDVFEQFEVRTAGVKSRLILEPQRVVRRDRRFVGPHNGG